MKAHHSTNSQWNTESAKRRPLMWTTDWNILRNRWAGLHRLRNNTVDNLNISDFISYSLFEFLKCLSYLSVRALKLILVELTNQISPKWRHMCTWLFSLLTVTAFYCCCGLAASQTTGLAMRVAIVGWLGLILLFVGLAGWLWRPHGRTITQFARGAGSIHLPDWTNFVSVGFLDTWSDGCSSTVSQSDGRDVGGAAPSATSNAWAGGLPDGRSLLRVPKSEK